MGQALAGFERPHHITINPYDPEKHVWIVDDGVQQVFKFTNDGKSSCMTLGERGRGNDDSISAGRPTSLGCPTARSS